VRRSALHELQGYQFIWAVLFIGFASGLLSQEALLRFNAVQQKKDSGFCLNPFDSLDAVAR